MLRVCGITFVRTTNYGSCFQAYALQKAIESITVGDGEACELQFIPLWRCSDHFSSARVSFFYSLFKRRFKEFQEKKIHYIACNLVSELPLLNESCDAFVCGSDVIWNPEFNHRLGLYYLDFASKYKFSYAASFGKSNLDDAFLNTAGKWIAELSEISVRESSSIDVVRQYAGREARVITDPVALLTREDWDRIAGSKRTRRGYIFSYATHETSEYQQFLQKLSETTGLRVVKAAWITSMRSALKQGMVMIQSPEQWLRQLRDADYVVTNSFHATVFSALFHKKFFTVVRGNRNEGSNIRMNDFLNTIGLPDRLITSVPETIDLSDVDFTQSERTIAEMREDGLQFLQENLEAAYAQKKERGLKA